MTESVIAIAVLAVAITAVFSALTAGTAHAVRSADELAATVAVEDLMARVLAEDPERMRSWHGHEEAPGTLVDRDGTPLAGGVGRVGRRVEVVAATRALADGPPIHGWLVQVEATTADGISLGVLHRWVPRDRSETST